MMYMSIHFSKNNTWLELLRHTVSVVAYSTTSSWHFLPLTPCTLEIKSWTHCRVFTEIPKHHQGLFCSIPVFFNFFFEAEPFPAILVAHGTHAAIARNLFRGHRWSSRPKAKSGEEALWKGAARESGGTVSSPGWFWGRAPTAFDALEPRKRVYWPQMLFSYGFSIRFGAEPLDAIGGTLRLYIHLYSSETLIAQKRKRKR